MLNGSSKANEFSVPWSVARGAWAPSQKLSTVPHDMTHCTVVPVSPVRPPWPYLPLVFFFFFVCLFVCSSSFCCFFFYCLFVGLFVCLLVRLPVCLFVLCVCFVLFFVCLFFRCCCCFCFLVI